MPIKAHVRQPAKLRDGTKKNTWRETVFYVARSFRRFQLNKSEQLSTETKQASSPLHFAPKNIQIHSVALENEVFEVAYMVSKKCQKHT